MRAGGFFLTIPILIMLSTTADLTLDTRIFRTDEGAVHTGLELRTANDADVWAEFIAEGLDTIAVGECVGVGWSILTRLS